MHITKITAENLKGESFTETLTPLTAIIGPNFSGKTARIEAIRLALLGHVPGLKKQNAAVFDLSSGACMTVTADLQDGETTVLAERAFWLEGDSIKTEAHELDLDLNTPLMDASAYFELTESQRVDYVFRRTVLPQDLTLNGIISRLEQMTFGEEHTEEIEDAKAQVVNLCRGGKPDGDIRDWINQAANVLKDEETVATRKAKDSIGAVRTLSDLRETAVTADTITALQNDASRLDGLLEEAGKTLGRLYQQRDEAERTTYRREELKVALDQPEPVWHEVARKPATEPVLRDLSNSYATLSEMEASAILASPAEDVEPYAEAVRVAIRAESQCEAALAEAACKVNEHTAKIHDINQQTCCPYCLSAKKGWAKIVEEKLRAELAEMEAAYKERLAALSEAKRNQEEAEKQFRAKQEARARWEAADSAASQLRRSIQAGAEESERATQAHQKLLKSHEANFKAECQRLKERKAAWWEQRAAHGAELERLQQVPAPDAAELATAEQAMEALSADRNALRSRIATAQKVQHDILRAEQAAAAHRQAEAKARVLKRARTVLLDLKGEMVAKAFETMLEVANRVISGILRFSLTYDAGRNEIGYLRAGTFVPHSTFSGTEKALAYTAIAAALSASSPFRLVILDELGRLAPCLRALVMARMVAMMRNGDLDQVIAVIPIDVGDDRGFDGQAAWTIIKTEARA